MRLDTHEKIELDPVFRVPSYSGRREGAIASGENSPEYRRARDIHQRATNLRDEELAGPRGPDLKGKKVSPLSAAEISSLGDEFSNLITSAETDESLALSTWREAMPLILADDFREKLDINGSGGPLTYYDKGSEALVFIDKDQEFVYKITPIREMVLYIPAVTGESPIYAKPIAHPLCDQYGTITMFQRNEAFNLLPGLAKTEIIVIAETQQVITKQPFLGGVASVGGNSWLCQSSSASRRLGKSDRNRLASHGRRIIGNANSLRKKQSMLPCGGCCSSECTKTPNRRDICF